MIGLDTNIVLRALTQDDPVQGRVAARLIEGLTPQRPGYLNLVVLVELVWNLSRKYRAKRDAVFDALEAILGSGSLVVAERAAVVESLERARSEGLDFADALIATLNQRAGCVTTLTFDEKANRSPLFEPP